MALKFLNKKGWHTGSLRNIENVWKAEQKHDAEQKKLEELRKQIQEERERSEFRLLQEQAGLVPAQERLDFLYDSGLAVGKSNSDGFKALEALPKPDAEASSSKQASVPGALFEDKPQSANDAWRKLHSDPLLLIRQREQEALARIKNNPIQMAMIRKSVEVKKNKKDHKKHRKKSKHERNPSKGRSDSEDATSEGEEDKCKRSRHARSHHRKSKYSSKGRSDSEGATSDEEEERSKRNYQAAKHQKKSRHLAKVQLDSGGAMSGDEERADRNHHRRLKHSSRVHSDLSGAKNEGDKQGKGSHSDEQNHAVSVSELGNSRSKNDTATLEYGSHRRHHSTAPKLSAEEKAARAREMQLDAELHEEQRWKRLKKAAEADAREGNEARTSRGRNFLDATQKSVYGTEKGGSSTIEESVRRRTYYLQGKSEHESNAFRR